MKRLIIILLMLSAILSSCNVYNSSLSMENESSSTVIETVSNVAETTETPVAETEPYLPTLIGLYDDLLENGTYTRLATWNDEWISGKDIAVFDVIPSDAETLVSSSYPKLWKAESEKISPGEPVKPYFTLEYVLTDETVITSDIYSWSDAEDVISRGYLEIYLYDDIHQDGGWYSHLTASTTNEETVISSVKLTAGKMIDSVRSIRFSAYIEGSSPATVNIQNGE